MKHFRLVLGALFLSSLVTLRGAEPPMLPLGAPLPDFRLPGVDGRDYTPADFAGARVLVVVFTSNHCPTAQAYEGRLIQLVHDYRERGVAVVAINPNHAEAVRLDEMGHTDLGDTFAELQERARHRGFNFPYLDDGPRQEVVTQFGARVTPHVFVFDAERRLRFRGRIDDSERADLARHHDLRDALDALLAGREPEVTTTRVFGCSVKWRAKVADNERFRARVAQEPVDLARAGVAELRALRANADSGKIRLVNVWATWCGPCVAEFPELVEHNLRFRHRGFELVTLAAQFPDEEPKVRHFLEGQRASMRNLIFGDKDKYALIEAFDPDWNGELPYTLLLAPGGEVLYRESGPVDFLALRRALLPALDDLTPWKNRDRRHER